MEFAYTVYFLAGVAGKGTHTETLTMVVRILTAHADKFLPGNAEFGRIAAHVLTEKSLVKIVMTSRNRGMDRIE